MRIKQWVSLVAAAAAGFLALAVAPAAAAENFPVKPIQLVIPFAPGDTDNMLRPFVERMAEFLGQPDHRLESHDVSEPEGSVRQLAIDADGHEQPGSGSRRHCPHARDAGTARAAGRRAEGA